MTSGQYRGLVVIANGLALVGLLPVITASVSGAQTFSDVPRHHWAYDAVQELGRRGILIGYPASTVKPATADQAPKTNKEQKLSTPQLAWKAVMSALHNGDEASLTRVLSSDCFAGTNFHSVPFLKLASSSGARAKAYRERAVRWKRRELILQRDTDDNPNIVHGHLVDMKAGPDAFDHWLEITLKKTHGEWRVTSLNY